MGGLPIKPIGNHMSLSVRAIWFESDASAIILMSFLVL